MTPKPGAEDWFTPWRFAGLLALFIFAAFPQVVTGFETFAYFDAGQFACPAAFYFRESFWRGEIPLWNPLSSCGAPFLAQWNTMTLYPPSLFYLVFPFPWSFCMFELGHLFLAGLGMYYLAYRWTGNRFAAALAGVIFAFNGLTWYGLMWPHIISALGWMPWVVLAMDRAWREGRRWIVFAALAAALQLLTGGVEVIIQTWLVIGAFWLVHLFRTQIPRGTMTLRTLAIAALAAGLAAMQLLPFLDLLAHSQRSSAYASSSMEAMPPTGWANYLQPLFHCARNAQGVFVQAGQTWTGSYYLGVAVVLLALLAVWRARNLPVKILAALTLLGLLLALGGNGFVYDRLKQLVPALGFIRFPVKFVVLATFALPLLAAFGLGWLQSLPANVWPREQHKTVTLTLVLSGVMAVLLWFNWHNPEDVSSIIPSGLLRILFLALTVAGLVLLRRESDVKLQRLWQTSFLLLAWLDVFTLGSNLSPTAASAVMEPDMIRHFFKWDHELQPGVSRAMLGKHSLWQMTAAGSPDPEHDVNIRRLSLLLNCNLLDHAAKFDGFYALDLKEYLDVFKHVYFTTNEAVKLKDFLGISHISNATNALAWDTRDSFLPLITAGQKPVFVSDDDALNAILGKNFEPLQAVYLPPEAQGKVSVANRANVRILQSKFSAQRIGADVDADAPAMLVIAQTYYHPWQAYVDGQPTPLWRANYAFQALEVPAGKHQVSVVYEDKMFHWGVILSLVSLLACAAAWSCLAPAGVLEGSRPNT